MTEKDVPTAALVEKINYQAKDGTMKDKIRIEPAVGILEDGDELVRRQDVQNLVENKIENSGYPKERIKLRELLEEIE